MNALKALCKMLFVRIFGYPSLDPEWADNDSDRHYRRGPGRSR